MQRVGYFLFQFTQASQVGVNGFLQAFFFILSSALINAGDFKVTGFYPSVPILRFSPSSEVVPLRIASTQFYTFAGGIEGKIEISREMDVGFTDVAVGFKPLCFVFF